MNAFFSLDGPFISFLDKVGRVILLSFLWVLCSIPIVTFGASCCAFYYGITKTVRHERSSSAKEFFASFKRCFKLSTIYTLLFIVAAIVLYLDILVWKYKGTRTTFLYMNVCIFLFILLIGFAAYLFPCISRFKYGFKDMARLAMFLEFKHLPVTFVVLLIIAVLALITIMSPVSLILFGGFACWLISILIENVFKKYIPKPEDGEELWYDE